MSDSQDKKKNTVIFSVLWSHCDTEMTCNTSKIAKRTFLWEKICIVQRNTSVAPVNISALKYKILWLTLC